jgi:hypothetical protein
MKKKDAEFKVATAAFDPKPRTRKYQHVLDLEVRNSKTGEGPTVIYENSHENYLRLCSGVIPRFNRNFKPKRWEFSISKDKSKIMIQRTA